MNDTELLVAAARAAGIDGPHQVDICGAWVFHSPRKKNWNPLTDDGDALRLAVKLKIDFYEGAGDGPEAWAGYYLRGFTKQKFACVPHRNDPYAATRCAIVRAAAEIGSLHNAELCGGTSATNAVLNGKT